MKKTLKKIVGYCSELSGDLDSCEITTDDRKKWIDIETLIED